MFNLKGKKLRKLGKSSKVIEFNNGDKRQLLKAFEKTTHLQVFINYILPNGQKVGALLLNEGTVDNPFYMLRFGWRTRGYHHVHSNEQADVIGESITSVMNEIPHGQKLRIQGDFFSDDGPVQQQYLELLKTCPPQLRKIVGQDMEINQMLHDKGIARPKVIYLWGSYKNNDFYELDFTERMINKLANWKDRFAGASEEINQQKIDTFLLDGYEQGYIPWSNLLQQKLQADTRCMDAEEHYEVCRADINRFNDRLLPPRPEVPLPQIITFDVAAGTIEEVINTRDSPIYTMVTNPSAIPNPAREHMAVDGKKIGCLYMSNHPKTFESSDSESAAKKQLQYFWRWLFTSACYDMQIIVEVSRPPRREVADTSARNIKQLRSQKKAKEDKGIIAEQDDVHLGKAIQAERDIVDKVVIEFAVTAFIYRDTQQQVRVSCQEACSYFNDPAKMVMDIDTTYSLWVSSRPFCAKTILLDIGGFRDRRDRTYSDCMPAMLPLLNTVSPHDSGLQFIDIKGGSPIMFDPFKNPGHTAIYGESRSGKTVLMIYLIYLALIRAIPSIVLDFPPTEDASSFKDFVKENNGSYFDVFDHCINLLETPEVPLGSSIEVIHGVTADTRVFQSDVLATICLGAEQKTSGYDSLMIKSLIGLVLERFWNDDGVLELHRMARQGGIDSEAWKEYPVLYRERKLCLVRFCTINHLNIDSPTDEQRNALNFIRERLQAFATSPYGRKLSSPSSFSLNHNLIAIAMRGKVDNDLAAVFGSVMFFLAYRKAAEAAGHMGSFTIVDETAIIFENPSISKAAAACAANGLKAGMRLVLAAQTPEKVLMSAGGTSFKANIFYNLIGKVRTADIDSYTNPKLMNLPKYLIIPNTEFPRPNKERGYSQWLLDIDGTLVHGRIYLPSMLVNLAANNIEEVRERREKQQKQITALETQELNYVS